MAGPALATVLFRLSDTRQTIYYFHFILVYLLTKTLSNNTFNELKQHNCIFSELKLIFTQNYKTSWNSLSNDINNSLPCSEKCCDKTLSKNEMYDFFRKCFANSYNFVFILINLLYCFAKVFFANMFLWLLKQVYIHFKRLQGDLWLRNTQ